MSQSGIIFEGVLGLELQATSLKNYQQLLSMTLINTPSNSVN
ncbi:hypothetical protein QWZ13_10035 [Reinekea marina]|nr:hypothetical protein [Reinekea marina]MDN3649251.1 hypothetical protein [Reinekea marina]